MLASFTTSLKFDRPTHQGVRESQGDELRQQFAAGYLQPSWYFVGQIGAGYTCSYVLLLILGLEVCIFARHPIDTLLDES